MLTHHDAFVATFAHHRAAEIAIRKLDAGRLDMRRFSIIGRDHSREGQANRVQNTGDLIRFGGRKGSIWGDLWGVFFSGIIVNLSTIGPVIVVGHLANVVFTDFEGAAVTGGFGVLGSAFEAIGLPIMSVGQYGDALKADGSLIVAHGPAVEMVQAKMIVETINPINVDLHQNVPAMATVPDAPF